MRARHFTSWFSSRLARQMDRFACPLDWILRKGRTRLGARASRITQLSVRRLMLATVAL